MNPGTYQAIFGGVFAVGGTAMILIAWKCWRINASTRDWPSATGIVCESGVAYDGEIHIPRIVYEYAVHGRTYRASRVQFGNLLYSSNPIHARCVASAYPANASIAVFYDPTDPASSVLERTLGTGTWAILGGGILFLLAGLAIAFLIPAGG